MPDEKIEFKVVEPVFSIAPRYPYWEIKVTGIGWERRTIMTEEEFKVWQSWPFG